MSKVDYSLLTPIQYKKLESDFIKKQEKQGKSKNTLENFATDFNTFRKFLKINKINHKIKELEIRYANLYIDFLISQYRSSNTIRRKVQSIRLFWGYLRGRKIIKDNPFQKLATAPKILISPQPTISKDIKKLWEFLIAQENKAVTPLSKIRSQRNKVAFILIFFAGLKTSEIENILSSNVMTDGNRILVNKENQEPYSIPINKTAMNFIKDYIKACDNVPIKNNVLLFNAKKSAIIHENLSARAIQSIFKYASEKLKINASPKSIRQACIFNWINSNISETSIRDRLGVAPDYDISQYTSMKVGAYDISFLKPCA